MMLLPILLAVPAATDAASLVARTQQRDPHALAGICERCTRATFALIVPAVVPA
jgi:hypothetical protein